MSEDSVIKEQKRRAFAVKAMTESIGWQEVILPELTAKLFKLNEELIETSDFNLIPRIQGEILAYRAILKSIENHSRLVD